MARSSRTEQPAAQHALRTAKPELGLEHEDDELGRDLLETGLSDEDLAAMMGDGDPPESLAAEQDDEAELFVRRRRIDDEEAAWQAEAIGDYHEMQSYRREYNDY